MRRIGWIYEGVGGVETINKNKGKRRGADAICAMLNKDVIINRKKVKRKGTSINLLNKKIS